MTALPGLTALVVGGTAPVGAAVCALLVRQGASVLIADGSRRVAEGTRLADALGPCARFELLDPRNEREWAATIHDGSGRFGGIDALVLVEPDATSVAMALRAAGSHLSRRGGAIVGVARSAAAAALSQAGIPVVELPDDQPSEPSATEFAEMAVRYVRRGLRGSPQSVTV